MKNVSDRLAEMRNEPGRRHDLEAATQLRQHFLHGHLSEEDLATARQATRRAIVEMLSIIGEEG